MLLHSLVRNVTNSVNYVTKLTNTNKIENVALHLKYREEKTFFQVRFVLNNLARSQYAYMSLAIGF